MCRHLLSLWQSGSIAPTSAHPSRHPAFLKPSSHPALPAAAPPSCRSTARCSLLLTPVLPGTAHGAGPVCRVQPRQAPAPGLAGSGCRRASTKPWKASVAELSGESRTSHPWLDTFQRQEEKPALGATVRPPSVPPASSAPQGSQSQAATSCQHPDGLRFL